MQRSIRSQHGNSQALAGHVPRKHFGQNFLVDQAVLRQMVDAFSLKKHDWVLEIGPGLGALTTHLLERLAQLDVVELDRDLAKRLQINPALTVHQSDILDFNLKEFLLNKPLGSAGLRVVGNIPYHITSPLIFHLMDYADHIRDQHFLLQKEVVDRLVAEPSSKAYGRLSVMVQYRYETEWVMDVPPECFFPPPKVDSAVVRMTPKKVEALRCQNPNHLSHLVAVAFSQRRKMLRNTFKALPPDFNVEALGFDVTRRAEEVSVAEYVDLANQLTQFLQVTGHQL